MNEQSQTPEGAWAPPSTSAQSRDSLRFYILVKPFTFGRRFDDIHLRASQPFVRTGMARSIEQELAAIEGVEMIGAVHAQSVLLMATASEEAPNPVIARLLSYFGRDFALRPGDDIEIFINRRPAKNVVIDDIGNITFE